MSAHDDKVQVVAAVLQQGPRYLLCQRAAGGAHGGLWEFPGGKVEAGESAQAALARELREELGLSRPQVGRELSRFVDEAHSLYLRFFSVRCDEHPQAREHRALRWCPLHEITQLALAPADRACAQELRKSAAQASGETPSVEVLS